MVNINERTGKPEAFVGDFGLSRYDTSDDFAECTNDEPTTSKFSKREIPSTTSEVGAEGFQPSHCEGALVCSSTQADVPTSSSIEQGENPTTSGNRAAQSSHHADSVINGADKIKVDARRREALRQAIKKRNFAGTRYFTAPEVVCFK